MQRWVPPHRPSLSRVNRRKVSRFKRPVGARHPDGDTLHASLPPVEAYRDVTERKLRFEELNSYITSRSGWVTSIPGAVEVTMQCLIGSTLPDELRARGYDLVEDGESERILPHAITDMVITEGSTVPIRITHAGIARVVQFTFLESRGM
jgi:hypothetical protein